MTDVDTIDTPLLPEADAGPPDREPREDNRLFHDICNRLQYLGIGRATDDDTTRRLVQLAFAIEEQDLADLLPAIPQRRAPWFESIVRHSIRPPFGADIRPQTQHVAASDALPGDEGSSFALASNGIADALVALRLTAHGQGEAVRRVAAALTQLREDSTAAFKALPLLPEFERLSARHTELAASRQKLADKLAACETQRKALVDSKDPATVAEDLAATEAKARYALDCLDKILDDVRAKLSEQRGRLLAGLKESRWQLLLRINDQANEAKRDLCGLLDGRDVQESLMQCYVAVRLADRDAPCHRQRSDVEAEHLADQLCRTPDLAAPAPSRVGVQVAGIDGRPTVEIHEPDPGPGQMDMNPVRVS